MGEVQLITPKQPPKPKPASRHCAHHRGPAYPPGSIVELTSHLTGRSIRIRIPG